MTNYESAVINKLKTNFGASAVLCVSVRANNAVTVLYGDNSTKTLTRHYSVYSLRRKKNAIIEAKTENSRKCAEFNITPDTRIFPQGEMRCGQIRICNIEDIEDVFDSDTTCAMTHDGTLFICANTIEEAYKQFEISDLIASICINAYELKRELSLLDSRHIALYKLNVTLPLMEELEKGEYDGENEAREALCKAISQLYNEKLFLDSNGAASIRLNENAFLITASNKERSSVLPEDIVLINNGRREPGKQPSNSAALHKLIYEKHPEINSIVISHPHHAMAYSGCSCDIILDDKAKLTAGTIVRYPFGTTVMQPEMFVNCIKSTVGAYLIENDCLICLGENVEHAVKITKEVERCAIEHINRK